MSRVLLELATRGGRVGCIYYYLEESVPVLRERYTTEAKWIAVFSVWRFVRIIVDRGQHNGN